MTTTLAASTATTAANFSNYYSVTTVKAAPILLLGMTLSCLGLALNILTLCALYNARMSTGAMRIGLVSLCLADSLVALANLEMLGFGYHSETDENGHADNQPQYRSEFCADEVFRRLWDVAVNVNQFTLVILAGQQCIAARWPLQANAWLTAPRTAAALAVAWCTSAVIGFAPLAVVAVTATHPNIERWQAKGTTRFCYQYVLYTVKRDGPRGLVYRYHFGQEQHERAHLIFASVVTSFVFLFLVSCYSYIIAVVRRTIRPDSSQLASMCVAHRRRRIDQRRIVAVTFLVALLFLVCFLPLFTCHTLDKLGFVDCINNEVFASLMTLLSLVPVLDPLVYAFRLKTIRDGFRRAASHCCPTIGIKLGNVGMLTRSTRTADSRLTPATASCGHSQVLLNQTGRKQTGHHIARE